MNFHFQNGKVTDKSYKNGYILIKTAGKNSPPIFCEMVDLRSIKMYNKVEQSDVYVGYNRKMKYNNEARTNKSNEKKRRIVECAMQLINEKGFDSVSVSEITNAAGVSKGAFYIHFKTKEDLIEEGINLSYDGMKLSGESSVYERLKYFLENSVAHIKEYGIKMAQEWFSQSVKGNFYGKSKLTYDRKAIADIVKDSLLADEIVSVYYGALNLWCFTDGEVDPEVIIKDYLEKRIKER